MGILKEIAIDIEKGDAPGVKKLTEKALTQNISPQDILNKALVSAINTVGIKFKNNEIFIPEVLIAARAMKAGMEIIRPLLAEANIKARGKIIFILLFSKIRYKSILQYKLRSLPPRVKKLYL